MRNKQENRPIYRHEMKYLISIGEKECLKARIKPVLKPDPHARTGGYTVRSLYFDDYWNRAYEEKEMGILSRAKYRIRIYDYSDRHIRLERKKKVDRYILKESAPLTREETEKILGGEYGFLLHSPYPLCREFYVECVSALMRPRVIVDYEREPFILDAGTVRVTFDNAVRASVLLADLFDEGLPSIQVLEPGKTIMEVKFTQFLPQIVRDILPPGASQLTAASKYVMCFEKTRYRTGFGYWEESGGRL